MKLIKSKNGTYKVRISTDHGPRTIKTGSKNKDEATAILKAAKVPELERAGRTVRLTNEVVHQIRFGKSVKASDALALWKEHLALYSKSAKTTANKLITTNAWLRDSHLLNTPTHSIKPTHIDRWINDPASTDKVGTRGFKLACLRAFFTFCAGREFILADPTKGLSVRWAGLTHQQKEPAKERAFTTAQFNNLMAHIQAKTTALEKERGDIIERLKTHANGRGHTGALERRLEENTEGRRRLEFWRIATLIGRHTGLRMGDICRLETATITDTPGRLVVWTGKKNRRVSLPLPTELRANLASLALNLPPDQTRCFPEEAATYADVDKRSGLSHAFSRLCDEAGAEGHGFHDLRSTYAQECRAAGIAMPHIAERLGHSSTETTEIYLQ